MKRFVIEFYGRGLIVRNEYVLAENKTDALLKFRALGVPAYEIICVRNLDFNE